LTPPASSASSPENITYVNKKHWLVTTEKVAKTDRKYNHISHISASHHLQTWCAPQLTPHGSQTWKRRSNLHDTKGSHANT